MRKKALILGSILLLVGGALFACDFKQNSIINESFINTYNFKNDEIKGFEIDIKTSDLIFILSSNNETKVVCEERENFTYNVKIVENVLKIECMEDELWYKNAINFNFKPQLISVYLSQNNFENLSITSTTGDIKIPHDFTFKNSDLNLTTGDVDFRANVLNSAKFETTTGNIKLSNFTSNKLDAKCTTGKIEMSNVKINEDTNLELTTGDIVLNNFESSSYNSKSTTGDVIFKETIIKNHLEVETTTGSVVFKNSDANTLNIKTTTGSVKGNLLTSKIFVVNTVNGKVRVPDSISGGICKVSTTTGSVSLKINK